MNLFRFRLFCLLIMFTAVLFLSCDKDCSFSPMGLEGDWKWEKSISGWGTWTPENFHEQRKVRINHHLYRAFINDSLVEESEYDIILHDTTFYGSPQVLHLNNGSKFILSYNASTLVLDESYNPDAPTHFYRRLR